MKKQTIISIIQILLGVTGLVMVGFFGNWLIAIGILLVVWSNDMLIFELIFKRINAILNLKKLNKPERRMTE